MSTQSMTTRTHNFRTQQAYILQKRKSSRNRLCLFIWGRCRIFYATTYGRKSCDNVPLSNTENVGSVWPPIWSVALRISSQQQFYLQGRHHNIVPPPSPIFMIFTNTTYCTQTYVHFRFTHSYVQCTVYSVISPHIHNLQ